MRFFAGCTSRVEEGGTDPLLLATAINNNLLLFNTAGLIVNDCKSLFTKIPEALFILYVGRSANMAAHTLARAVSSLSGLQEWVSTTNQPTPHFLLDILLKDCFLSKKKKKKKVEQLSWEVHL